MLGVERQASSPPAVLVFVDARLGGGLCPLGQEHVLGPVIATEKVCFCRSSKLSLDSSRRRFTRAN